MFPFCPAQHAPPHSEVPVNHVHTLAEKTGVLSQNNYCLVSIPNVWFIIFLKVLESSVPPLQADKMFSEAHDELYQFSFESHRWFPVALRKPKLLKADADTAASAGAEASPPAADTAQNDGGASSSGGQEKVSWATTHLSMSHFIEHRVSPAVLL